MTRDDQALPPPPPPPPTSNNNNNKRKHWSVDDSALQTSSSQSTPARDPSAWTGVSSGSVHFKKSITGFLGLSNQGATCYLNSLIQTLFMTPEIRRILFAWQYDAKVHGEEDKCIPLQLQKLFARLQLSDEKAVSTTELTQSFGWTKSESFVQHDVQELCRVLFEALDKTLTPKLYQQRHRQIKEEGMKSVSDQLCAIDPRQPLGNNLVSDLYAGIMIDYIKAKDVTSDDGSPIGRFHEDLFLDVQLVIRDAHSIEEALDLFVKPEILDGENQWKCEQLNRNVDAIKGLRFKSFPYLLTLHLKRFDYDIITWQRIKLANKVTFPFEIDVGKFVDGPAPTKYELFSVLVHSGTARAGHYYAYIKSFKTGKWMNFNDSNVSEITEDDVKKMFGMDEGEEPNKTVSKQYASSTNAYMLMYRLIDTSKNVVDVSDEEIPQTLRDVIQKENEVLERERLEYEDRQRKVTVRVWYRLDTDPISLTVYKNITFGTLTKLVWDALEKQPEWTHRPLECIRLREWNLMSRQYGKHYAGKEDQTLEQLNWITFRPLCVQTRNEHEEWPIEMNLITVYLFRFNNENNDFDPINAKLDANSTLGALKSFLSQSWGADKYPAELLHVILDDKNCGLKPFTPDDDQKQIESELGIKEQSLLYVEALEYPGAKSRATVRIHEQQNCFEIYYNKIGTTDYNQHLTIEKGKTVGDLRIMIAQLEEIPEQSFRILDKRTKLPHKNDKLSLTEASIFDYTTLHIEKGTLIKSNECVIKLYLYVPEEFQSKDTPSTTTTIMEELDVEISENNTLPLLQQEVKKLLEEEQTNKQDEQPTKQDEQQAPKLDEQANKQTTTTSANASSEMTPLMQELLRRKKEFKLLGKMIVKEDMKLLEFKQMIARLLQVPSVEHIRVRAKISTLFGTLFCDNQATLKENYSYLMDGKQFMIQLLRQPETLMKGDSIVNVQQWFSSVWKFGPKRELIANEKRFKSTEQLKELIGKEHNIPLASLQIAKAPQGFELWTQKECADIALLNWTLSSDNVFARPFMLKDGEYIFFRNKDEPEKIALDELRKMISMEDKSIVFNGASATKEQQLKIRTLFDSDTQDGDANQREKGGEIEAALATNPPNETSSSQNEEIEEEKKNNKQE